MHVTDKMLANIDQMILLHEQSGAKLKQLRRATLLMQEFGTDIHKHGPVSTRVTGNQYKGYVYRIEFGPHMREKPLEDVPVELWPDYIELGWTKYAKMKREGMKAREEQLAALRAKE